MVLLLYGMYVISSKYELYTMKNKQRLAATLGSKSTLRKISKRDIVNVNIQKAWYVSFDILTFP
jgi:hypothetical protein